MTIDLHVHTTASDGALSPQAVVARAREHGVTHLSITDHDTLAAYTALCGQDNAGLRITAGVEFSTVWQGVGVHILGYAFDPAHQAILDLVAYQAQCRSERVEKIAARLTGQGIDGSLAWLAQQYPGAQLGRPHFARFLVSRGVVADSAKAFKKYLGAGKTGDVKQDWASCADVVQTITTAGGLAVLAHPGQYRLTNTKLRRLLDDFRALGGSGLEVVSGRQTPDRTQYLGQLCRAYGLLASSGSDFHAPGKPWREIGRQSPLPMHCQPVWEAFA